MPGFRAAIALEPAVGPAVQHGHLARAALVVVGAVFASAGTAVAGIFGRALVLVPSARAGAFAAVAVPCVLLFAGVAALGVNLLLRGARGRSRPRFARASQWYLRHWYAVWLVSSGLAAGAAALAVGPRRLILDPSVPRAAWYAFLAVLLLPVHAAFHEAGHAAAGVLVGFRFATLRIGRLVVERRGGRFRVLWNALGPGGMLGFHLAVPGSDRALAARYGAFSAGGPGATLAVAAACRAGAALAAPSTLGSALVHQLLAVGCWTGVYLALSTLLPLRYRNGFSSDGAHLLDAALSRAPAGKAALRVRALASRGCRPRAWGLSPEALLRAAAHPRYRDVLVWGAVAVALDRGDAARIDEVLERVAQLPPPRNALLRCELQVQAAMVEAFRGNPAAARERLARLAPQMAVPAAPSLADAVIHAVEGHAAEARAARDAWSDALGRAGLGRVGRVGSEWALEALGERLGG